MMIGAIFILGLLQVSAKPPTVAPALRLPNVRSTRSATQCAATSRDAQHVRLNSGAALSNALSNAAERDGELPN
jgi:hypothetical protein